VSSQKNIVVIGMGCVGIPCVVILADVAGFRMTGVKSKQNA